MQSVSILPHVNGAACNINWLVSGDRSKGQPSYRLSQSNTQLEQFRVAISSGD